MKYTDEEIAGAAELLDAAQLATAAGCDEYSTEEELRRAGLDHYPPTGAQIRKAQRIVDAH